MKCPMKFGAEAGKDACVGEECAWYVDAYGFEGCAVALSEPPRRFILGMDDVIPPCGCNEREGGGE